MIFFTCLIFLSFFILNYNTKALQFYGGSGITSPVNPNVPNPNFPVFPQNSNGTRGVLGTGSSLSIDFVSSFNLRINSIFNENHTYFAKAQSYFNNEMKSPNYIQVTDNRGTLTGWRLSVIEKREIEFMDKAVSKYSVPEGASLSLAHPIMASNSRAISPSVSSVTNLIPDTEMVIATAKSGQGAGTWVIRWGEQEDLQTQDTDVITPAVKLFVPGTTGKKGEIYGAKLTWSLAILPEP